MGDDHDHGCVYGLMRGRGHLDLKRFNNRPGNAFWT